MSQEGVGGPPDAGSLLTVIAGEHGRNPAGSVKLPSQGTLVGRYVVLSILGQGAMGVVLAAYDPELDRRVALKLLKPRGGDQEAARTRLQREAQALARLNHPNVVAVHDVGLHEGQVFVAMEFVEGTTLRKWMRRDAEAQPWHWTKVLRVFEAAGRGLAAAHEAGLIHRDFKPDNVMFGADGRVRVMDFGLARTTRSGDEAADESDPSEPSPPNSTSATATTHLASELTRTGAMVGTPAYMAPEQFEGREVTARSDQFAFCVALWEALYAARPYPGKTWAELLASTELGRPVATAVSVPGSIRTVLERGLRPDPSLRFASMHELLDALANAVASRRRRPWFAVAGAMVLLTGAALGYVRWDRDQRVALCGAEGDRIDGIWNSETRADLRTALEAPGVDYASLVADRVLDRIDEQAEDWRRQTDQSCHNGSVEQVWSQGRIEKTRWCLERRYLELATLIRELGHGDEQTLQEAIKIAAAVTPASWCMDERSLSGMASPPAVELRGQVVEVEESLSRVHHLRNAGRFADAGSIVVPARQRAEAIQWPPLIASAHLAEARVLDDNGTFDEAEEHAMVAYVTAAEAQDWIIAAEAAEHMVVVVGARLGRHEEGKTWAKHAEVANSIAGDHLGLREAKRARALGWVLMRQGKLDEALALYTGAYETRREVLGEYHPSTVYGRSGVATVLYQMGDIKAAQAVFVEVLAARKESLGALHPEVGNAHVNLGAAARALGDFESAKAHYDAAIELFEASLGPEHPRLADALNNLGNLYVAQGEFDNARPILERSLAIRQKTVGNEHPDTANTIAGIGTLLESEGKHQLALEHFERSLEIWENLGGNENPQAASLLSNIATCHISLGNSAQAKRVALQAVERAGRRESLALPRSHALQTLARSELELREFALAIEHLEAALEVAQSVDLPPERLNRTNFLLARALWEAAKKEGRDRPRALALARETQEQYAATGRHDDEREISQWLAERAGATEP